MKTQFKLMALTLGLSAGMLQAQSIDASKSQVKWTGYGIGKSHWGYVDIKSADVSFDKKAPKTGEVVIDLETIQTKDLEGKMADNLNGHLKSADFFETSAHPTATFKANKIIKNKDTYTVDGVLTIKGKAENKTVTLKETVENKQKFLVGALKFDRSKFDVKYNSDAFFDVAKLGDKLIKNEIDLELKLAVKE